MKKETITVILGTVLGTVLGITLVLIVIGLAEERRERENIVSSNNLQEIQQNMRADFIEGCSSELSVGNCACMYDILEDTYGVDGIADMTADYLKTGEIADKYLDTAMMCLK